MRKLRHFRWDLFVLVIAGFWLTNAVSEAWAQRGGLTVPMNLARMVDESENVVLARVTSVVAEPHPQFPNLDTVAVTLEVIDPLKGAPGKQLTFRQFVFDVTDRDSKLGYRIGEEVVVCLRQASSYGLTSPVGFEQGRFRVERDASNNRILRNGDDNAALFDGVEQTVPNLRPRLAAAVQQLVTQHHAGPVSYDQFKSFVNSVLAARQAGQ